MKLLLWVVFLVAAGLGAAYVASMRGGAEKAVPTKPPAPKPTPAPKPAAEATPAQDANAADPVTEDEPTDPGPAPKAAEPAAAPEAAPAAAPEAAPAAAPEAAPAAAPEAAPAAAPEAAPEPVPAAEEAADVDTTLSDSPAPAAPAAEEEVEDEDTSDDSTADQDGGGRTAEEDTGDKPTVDEEEEEIDATFKMEAVTIKGVDFDGLAAMRALSLLNNSDEDALKAAGLKGRPLKLILENRPFQNMVELGEVKGMGTKTLELIHKATE